MKIKIKLKHKILKKYFASIGKEIYERSQECTADQNEFPHINLDTSAPTDQLFRPQPIDSDTLILVIKHMKNTSASSSDGITLHYIKESLPVIIPYPTCILNTPIVIDTFPTQWKHFIVVPIFKTGNVNEPKNFRPISLLPFTSKILEQIIARQFNSFLEANHLSNTQHGFLDHLCQRIVFSSLYPTSCTRILIKRTSL